MRLWFNFDLMRSHITIATSWSEDVLLYAIAKARRYKSDLTMMGSTGKTERIYNIFGITKIYEKNFIKRCISDAATKTRLLCRQLP